MIIKKKRIRALETNFGFLKTGSRFIFGVRLAGLAPEKLVAAGLPSQPKEGDSVLPPAAAGPVSRYNAEGKYLIHKDQEKETAYRQAEWKWHEWRGRYDSVQQSRIVDVPYERYPRTFLPPPSVELTVSTTASGEAVVVVPELEYLPENQDSILHSVNLLLEIFGEGEVFTEDLKKVVKARLRRLNWEILPPGCRPWSDLKGAVKEILEETKDGNRVVIENRFETINEYGPEFAAVGRAGFRGYLIFGFPEKGLYILESTLHGNATYVFSEDWEDLSKMTKAEILSEELQEDRIIHREGWPQRIEKLLS